MCMRAHACSRDAPCSAGARWPPTSTVTWLTLGCMHNSAQNLHQHIMTDIAHHKYTQPTPIQCQGIPIALTGRDILGCAETGSGKTASFSIPMVQHCLNQPALRGGEGPIGLVLAPTRELAQQIEREVGSCSTACSACMQGNVHDGVLPAARYVHISRIWYDSSAARSSGSVGCSSMHEVARSLPALHPLLAP